MVEGLTINLTYLSTVFTTSLEQCLFPGRALENMTAICMKVIQADRLLGLSMHRETRLFTGLRRRTSLLPYRFIVLSVINIESTGNL